LAGPSIFFPYSIMYFPKAAAVFLCVTTLSEAFSIPDVEYHLAARTPQKFGQGGSGGGRNRANNGVAKASNGAGIAKTSTTAATVATSAIAAPAAASSAAKPATGNNKNNNNNNAAAGNGAAGTACLNSNAVQTGSADDGNATPKDGQSASAT
jgi:hypothetical protein